MAGGRDLHKIFELGYVPSRSLLIIYINHQRRGSRPFARDHCRDNEA